MRVERCRNCWHRIGKADKRNVYYHLDFNTGKLMYVCPMCDCKTAVAMKRD